MPVASQKILGTWDPSSALFLFLEEAGEAGTLNCAALPSACPNCLLVFPAESYRQHKNSQVIRKVTYCALTNGRRRALRIRGHPLSPAGNTFPAFWDP